MKAEEKPCEECCKGRIIDKDKGVYCEHIEAKLPKYSRQSIKAHLTDRIEDYWLREVFMNKPLTMREILDKLWSYGLERHERKLVYYTAVLGLPFEETVKKMGWLNTDNASYHYRKALRKLREGGFKP